MGVQSKLMHYDHTRKLFQIASERGLSLGEINAASLLRRFRIRPTKQRLALAALLFAKGNRHITAEELWSEAKVTKAPVSYATIYNVLNLFSSAGLIRSLTVEGHPTIYDTNMTPHHHLFFEDKVTIVDLPSSAIGVNRSPKPPDGYEISRLDIVVRLRPNKAGR